MELNKEKIMKRNEDGLRVSGTILNAPIFTSYGSHRRTERKDVRKYLKKL